MYSVRLKWSFTCHYGLKSRVKTVAITTLTWNIQTLLTTPSALGNKARLDIPLAAVQRLQSGGEVVADGRDGKEKEGETGGTPVWDLQRRCAHLAADRTASQVSRSNRTPLIRQYTLRHTYCSSAYAAVGTTSLALYSRTEQEREEARGRGTKKPSENRGGVREKSLPKF